MYWPEYPYAPVTATRIDGFAPFTGLQAADEEAGGLIDQAEREPPADPSAHLYIVSVMMALAQRAENGGVVRHSWLASAKLCCQAKRSTFYDPVLMGSGVGRF